MSSRSRLMRANNSGGSSGPSLAQSTVSAATSSVDANAVDTSVITVTLKTASGANYGRSGGTVAMSSTNSGTLGAVTDNGDGTYTATFTSPLTLSGASCVVSATLNGSAITNTATVTCLGFAAAMQSALVAANITAGWVIGLGTTQSGGVISSVSDSVGTLGVAQAAAGSKRPAYITNAIRSALPVARLDGTDDNFASASAVTQSSGPLTYLVIYNPVSAAGTNKYLIDSTTNRQVLEHLSGTANKSALCDSGGTERIFADAATGLQILSAEVATNNIKLYRNGAQIASGATATQGALGGTMTIGAAFNSGSLFVAMDLAAALVCSIVDTTKRHAAEVRAGKFYGITIT